MTIIPHFGLILLGLILAPIIVIGGIVLMVIKFIKISKIKINPKESKKKISKKIEERVSEEGKITNDVFSTNKLYGLKPRIGLKKSKKYQRYFDVYSSPFDETPSAISEVALLIKLSGLTGEVKIKTKEDEISASIEKGFAEISLNGKNIGKMNVLQKTWYGSKTNFENYDSILLVPQVGTQLKNRYSPKKLFDMDFENVDKDFCLKFKNSKEAWARTYKMDRIDFIKQAVESREDLIPVMQLRKDFTKKEKAISLVFLTIMQFISIMKYQTSYGYPSKSSFQNQSIQQSFGNSFYP